MWCSKAVMVAIHGSRVRWRRVLVALATAAALGCGGAADPGSTVSGAVKDAAACVVSNQVGPTAAQPAIQARLNALAALFRRQLPTRAAVLGFFDAASFYQNGLGLDAWLDQVLLRPRSGPDDLDYVGFTARDLEVEKSVDANHVWVTWTAAVSHPGSPGGRVVSFRPWTERMLATWSCGQWRLAGNQRIAAAEVGFLARLVEKPLTQAQLEARPDVIKAVATWDPQQRTYYQLVIPDPPNPDLLGWIGFPGDDGFGTFAWVGDYFDYPWTPDVNERQLRRQYNQYLASPDSRVRAYLVFRVSARELDPRVVTVHVSGPGLPSEGLNLVRSPDQFPRPDLIFRGDQYHWNAFTSDRCASMSKQMDDPSDPRDYIPDCALDWSKVRAGASYRYDFRDGAGASLGRQDLVLRGEVLDEETWYAARDQYLGQIVTDASTQFTIQHVLDDTPGAPFVAGGVVPLRWQMPARADLQLEGVSYWREYFLGDAFTDPSSRRQEEHWYQLYGSGATAWTAVSDPNGLETTWAWSTLNFRDRYGNWFTHEVSPGNPY